MEIRSITGGDYDAVIDVWTKSGLSFRPHGRDGRDEMTEEFNENPDLILGAYEKDELVGVIVGTDDGRKGWINRLAVLPESRRRGVGSALIAACEKALRKRGRRIICTLVEDNYKSLELFRKVGYTKHENILYLSKRENDDV
jgi:ribosomal protein S18 acetylase RimI-like enzyme